MRLIDADNYKGKCICNRLYCGVTKIIEVDSVPTSYDMDKVVQKIRELQLKIKDKSLAVEDEEYAVMLRGQLRGIADCLEIVKSGGIADE